MLSTNDYKSLDNSKVNSGMSQFHSNIGLLSGDKASVGGKVPKDRVTHKDTAAW